MHTHRWITRFAFVAALALGARADVRLPGLFTDNMVLQRDVAAPIWGWADDGEAVTIEINGKTVKTVAKDGKFKAKLPRLKANSQPTTLTVKGKNTIEVKNVLVGEVWVASGQSNMEWPLRSAFEPQAAIDASANPNIRLFTVPKNKQMKPVDDVKASWQECNPQTVPGFSAVAYFFGRDLQKELGVPVGLIHTSWGGSPAEAWVSQPAFDAMSYKKEIVDFYAPQYEKYDKDVAAWEKEKADLEKDGKKITRNRPFPTWHSTELYNGMIAPLIPYAIKGAIWYQGESNAGRNKQYRALYPDMIKNWRKDWGQDFTFLGVQLAPFDPSHTEEQIKAAPMESDWAALREAQVYATQTLPKTGIAVITDVGERTDIHPKKKEPVGHRLALQALKIAYGKKITAAGPTFKSMKVKCNEAILSFKDVDGGLVAQGGDLTGFAIAGPDGKFVWGKAKIEGNKVVVSSPEVTQPTAVRYGWNNYPIVNLANKEGLPASPFRTDSPK